RCALRASRATRSRRSPKRMSVRLRRACRCLVIDSSCRPTNRIRFGSRSYRRSATNVAILPQMRGIVAVAIMTAATAFGAPRVVMKVGYDLEHLDLDRHVLQFTLTRPAGRAE